MSISSAYHFDTGRFIFSRPRQGSHRSRIFYHYFSRAELVAEVEQAFAVSASKIMDITLPGEARLNLSPSAGGKLSRFLEHIPLLRNFGYLVLVRGLATKQYVPDSSKNS
jgi:hypothetical protein